MIENVVKGGFYQRDNNTVSFVHYVDDYVVQSIVFDKDGKLDGPTNKGRDYHTTLANFKEHHILRVQPRKKDETKRYPNW